MKKDIGQDKQDNKTKRDPAETEVRIMRTGLNKAMDALTNSMRKIGLLMAKLFDAIFKTNISGSPFLNNKIVTGKKFIVAKKNNKQQNQQQQKNRGGGHVKISKANPSEKDNDLIQIKDVLHGKASDVALQKQQERQAEAGHRFFSKALNINKSQTNTNTNAMSK